MGRGSERRNVTPAIGHKAGLPSAIFVGSIGVCHCAVFYKKRIMPTSENLQYARHSSTGTGIPWFDRDSFGDQWGVLLSEGLARVDTPIPPPPLPIRTDKPAILLQSTSPWSS